MKLNLGCGRDVRDGWCNVDVVAVDKRVMRVELDGPQPLSAKSLRGEPMPAFPVDEFDEFAASHVLEHIRNLLPLMEACWRCAKPGALFTARVPYGASDDADEDPTHVRRFFLGSWGYFGQPNYWRADYGYRGDWQCRRVLLRVDGKRLAEMGYEQTLPHVLDAVNGARNVCVEMVAELVAVKPAREPRQELATPWAVDAEIL